MPPRVRCWASAILTAGALAAIEPTAAAAATRSAYAKIQNSIEGYWNVDDAARREAQERAGRPELTPAAQAAQAAQPPRPPPQPGARQVLGLQTYLCGINSPPNIYTTSEPWTLVVSKDRVVQAGERFGMIPRYFYTDGRSWPDLTKLPRSTNGYAIGHWEGKDLVVETRGLPTGGGFGPPRGPNTVLTERFSVSPNGKRLTITITFTDPDLLAKPYSYQTFYDRAEEHIFAYGSFCDPNDDPAYIAGEPPQDAPAK